MWELLLWGIIIIETISTIIKFILLKFIIEDHDNFYVESVRMTFTNVITLPLFFGASYFILTQGLLYKLPDFWQLYYKILFAISIISIPSLAFFSASLVNEEDAPELTTWRVIDTYLIGTILYFANIKLFWELLHL